MKLNGLFTYESFVFQHIGIRPACAENQTNPWLLKVLEIRHVPQEHFHTSMQLISIHGLMQTSHVLFLMRRVDCDASGRLTKAGHYVQLFVTGFPSSNPAAVCMPT